MAINWDRMRKGYVYSLKRMKECGRQGKKIRVGFAVVFDGVFPMAPVFERMREDDFFDAFLIVIPDISRGRENGMRQYITTRNSLKAKYPDADIINTSDHVNMTCYDIASICDIYCTANPYDSMTMPNYGIDYFWRKHIPVIYANYGFDTSRPYQMMMRQEEYFGKFWRIYAENQDCFDDLSKNPVCKNIVLSGYPKMDALARQDVKPRERKCIIVAPHHSIIKNGCHVNFGQFLYYADFFLELPKRYPDIDFIFRPHPILFTNLNMFCGADKADEYWRKIEDMDNCVLQRCGDYMYAFANSDGLIHDCGSFVAEYLYTGKPCCRMLPKDVDIEREYSDFGIKCVKCHYYAYNEQDIVKFIEEVVKSGNDPKKQMRQEFFAQFAINYPRSAEFIVNDIKDAIMNS